MPLRSTPIAMLTQSSRLVCLLLFWPQECQLTLIVPGVFFPFTLPSPAPNQRLLSLDSGMLYLLLIQARCLLGHPAEP